MTNKEDTSSLEYWINFETFGIIDEKYKEQPDYVEAQQFWAPRKLELLKAFKANSEVLRFLHNLTVMCFYKNDEGIYGVSLIIKDGKPQRPCYSHSFIDLMFDPNALMKKRIKITEYDGFQYDVYDELMDQHYNDTTFDDARIDREVLLAFIKTTGWNDLLSEDVSTIFNPLLDKMYL
jgi:hypothetical protein